MSSGISFTGLQPELVSLGTLIGLLEASGDPAAPTVTLDPGWFADPLTPLRKAVTTNGDALASLLGQLLGSTGGTSLGVPVTDPAFVGTWYPILLPGEAKPNGLSLVSYKKGDDTVFGLGVLRRWDVGTDTKIGIRVWGLVPFLKIGGGSVGSTFTTAGYPITMGIAVEGDDDKPLLDAAGLSFQGVKVSADIDMATPSADLSVVVMQLKLPDEDAPSDRSLADLTSASAAEIEDVASALFIAALSRVSPDFAKRAEYVLPAFGLSTIVPGSKTQLPRLAWEGLAGADGSAPFRAWFRALASDPDLTTAWLTCLVGAMGETGEVTGTGSRTDPFAAPLIDLGTGSPPVGVLSFTLASVVQPDGQRRIYPGLRFVSAPLEPVASSPAVLTMRATAELAEFTISEGAPANAGPDPLQFSLGLDLTNKDPALPLVASEDKAYSFGSLSAGLALGSNFAPLPRLTLNDVVTPDDGKHATIDLLSPASLAKAAESLIAAQLRKLFGLGDGSARLAFASNAAALLGVIPPNVAGGSWPADAPQPPFTVDKIVDSIQHPIDALAGYYRDLLAAQQVEGKAAFAYVVAELAELAHDAAESAAPAVTGDGTAASPWQAPISAADGLPALVIAYTEPGDAGATRLVLGVELAPVVTAGTTTIVPSLSFELLSIDLPGAGGGSISALWAPRLAAAVTLPDGFTSDPVGGASFAMGAAALSAGWSRSDGWGWSVRVEDSAVTIDGNKIDLGTLDFSDVDALRKLVSDDVPAFVQVVAGVIGAALLRTATRAGTTVAGAFGLLADISSAPAFPAGLTWPKDIPPLALTGFVAPWPALRQRLAADFASDDTAKAVLALLGWTLDDSLTEAPAIAGTRDVAAPLRVPAGKLPFSLLFWYAQLGQTLGAGLGRVSTTALGPVQATTEVRLNVIEVSLESGTVTRGGNAPSLSFTTTLAGTSGPLVPASDALGSLGSAQLGITVSLGADGTFAVSPVVTLLDVTLPGGTPQAALTLADFSGSAFTQRLQEGFLALLDQAVSAGAAAAAKNPAFVTAYDLLTALGLTLPRPAYTDPYGINPAGWTALLAGPEQFLLGQLGTLLTDPANRAKLFTFVAGQLGITLPTVPPDVLAVLEALGITGPAAQGYPLRPDAVLAFATNPLPALANAFQRLVGDVPAATRLAEMLVAAAAKDPQKAGPVTFTASGTTLSLSIAPADAVDVAGVVRLRGTLSIDIGAPALGTGTPTVGLELHAFVPALNVDAVSKLAYQPGSGNPPVPVLELAWGDGTRPAPAPLQLYPFDGTAFVGRLADLAPAYVLSTLATAALEAELLAHPLAQQVFAGLGLAKKVGDTWQMPPLLGLLHDPGAWLLSKNVLGKDGKFDVAGFAEWLSGLPAVSAKSGFGTVPVPNKGVQVQGLPYGVTVSLTGENGVAAITAAAAGQSIAGGAGKLDQLSVGVTLGPDYQPGIKGAVAASHAGSPAFSVAVAYDKSFTLAVSQPGTDGLAFQLVPFQGLGSLVDAVERAAPALLLKKLVPKVLELLSTTAAGPFVTKLTAAGTALKAGDLADALAAAPLTADGLEHAAVTWLQARLAQAEAAATVQAIETLLSGIVPVTMHGNLIAYTPSDKLPLTVLTGLNEKDLAGIWLELAIPKGSLFRVAVQRTGVGVSLADLSKLSPVVSFGAAITVPVEDPQGPQLALGFDGSTVSLTLDPVGSADGGAASAFEVQLLPQFFPGSGGTVGSRVETWLAGVATHVLPRYVAAAILAETKVHTWLDTPIASSAGAPAPGGILVAASLLKKRTNPDGYDLVDFDTLSKLSIEGFAANFLKALLATHIDLVTFGKDKDGHIWIGPKQGAKDTYGVGVVAPDYPIRNVTNVVLQLGAKDVDWIAGAGGDATLAPGLAVYVPIDESGEIPKPQFSHLEIDLINVGVDFTGKQNLPLVDKPRFKLGAVAPRALLSLVFAGGAPTATFGLAAGLKGVALSLAPNALPSSGSSNPVAQNLLGSGSSGSTAPNPPANPSFDVEVAYAKHLFVELTTASGTANPIVFPVQRSFGPLHVNSLGVGWTDATDVLDVLFDGSVALAGLEVDVQGLDVGIPVNALTDTGKYSLDLKGLDISFKGGAVSISGTFLKSVSKDGLVSYTGSAIVQAASFGLAAIGSYAMMAAPGGGSAPSLFVFAALNASLGGPPAFFIKGVAAGFGYNRSLTLPPIDKVQDFPLVDGVVKGSFSGDTTPEQAMAVIADAIQPEIGQYWLAAGLKFTSFEMIDAVALLFVQFGRVFEIDLLGLAFAPLPKGVSKDNALAYVELALKATIQPDQGVVSVLAQLTPNSYIIAKDCKLTGGFAFCLWLKDLNPPAGPIHAGDFVITLGGYHPAFQKPAHYPDVPRLGFSWRFDAGPGTVSIGGGAYFALVPTAVMAGGYLNVSFDAGPLRAWLDASADFLIQWAPFHFEVDIHVSIGASFGTTILGVSVTLTIEMGADLNLQGPPTHGSAHVSWFVISFTIPIGSGDTPDDKHLDWPAFSEQFLPRAKPAETGAKPAGGDEVGVRAQAAAAAPGPVQPLKAAVAKGRQGGSNGDGDADAWVVRTVPFALRIDTAIPTTSITVAGTAVSGTTAPPVLGVRPMALTEALQSPLTITVTGPDGPVDLSKHNVSSTPVTNGAPAALWSRAALDPGTAPDASAMILPGAWMGVLLDASAYTLTGSVPAFPLENLKYTDASKALLPFADTPEVPRAQPYDGQGQAIGTLMRTIMSPAVVIKRNAALAALQSANIPVVPSPSLVVMAASADLIVQARPVLARPAVFQAATAPAPTVVAAATPFAAMGAAPQPRPPREPRLVATLRSYRSRVSPPSPAVAGLPRASDVVLRRFVDETHGAPSRARLLGFAANGRTSLHAGALGIWEIDPDVPHAVDARGPAQVRVTCFDAFGEAVADVHRAPAEPQDVPAGTATIAVQAGDSGDAVVGWQIDSELVQLNRYYAAIDGCLIRAENPPRIRRKGRPVTRGMVGAHRFVEENVVRTSGGRFRPGWIETAMPAGRNAFAVAVGRRPNGGRPALHVTAAFADKPGAVGDQPLAPAFRFDHEDVSVLIYATPAAHSGGALLTVIARPEDEGTNVLGVYGFAQGPGALAHSWSEVALGRSGVDLDDGAVRGTRVGIMRAKAPA